MVRRIKLVLAYDGSAYVGWQRQASLPTVQGKLEEALEELHGHQLSCEAAGRTDAGVHASGQVVSFSTDIASIPAWRFVLALNALLPQDIRVLSVVEAKEDFHARFSAKARAYLYRIAYGPPADLLPQLLQGPVPDGRAWLCFGQRANITCLNAMAGLLLGEQDFSTFRAAGDQSSTALREVFDAAWRWEGESLLFYIRANAFLLHMVRSLVGTMLEIEGQGRSEVEPKNYCLERFSEILKSKDRRQAGCTAPAQGLALLFVEY